MIISHNFGLGLEGYVRSGQANDFPVFDSCPNCGCFGPGNVRRHGFYWRNGVTETEEYRLPICRFRCAACSVTISILPDFLLPYFQHTLGTVLGRIQELLERKKAAGSRQICGFYKKRYFKNLHWIHSFFMDQGERTGFSEDQIKEAKKYLKRILDFGESSFLRRSWGHLTKYLMAN